MIVFDSSTLILLARTDLMERFISAVNEVIVVPKAVEKESCEEKGSVDAFSIRSAIHENRIRVISLKKTRPYEKFCKDFDLGRGETEAIFLAYAEKARLLATDDKRAIHACRLLKIPYTTAIGILLRLHRRGLLEKDEAHLKLDALERYGRYKREILLDARSKLEGESCQRP